MYREHSEVHTIKELMSRKPMNPNTKGKSESKPKIPKGENRRAMHQEVQIVKVQAIRMLTIPMEPKD